MTLNDVFPLNLAPFFYSYLKALIGLLFATLVVFPETVSHAITSAINPEARHIGIINNGLIWY